MCAHSYRSPSRYSPSPPSLLVSSISIPPHPAPSPHHNVLPSPVSSISYRNLHNVQSGAANQACHREQFADWKQKVNGYVRHFQAPLSFEYTAEKEQVMQRISKYVLSQVRAESRIATGTTYLVQE